MVLYIKVNSRSVQKNLTGFARRLPKYIDRGMWLFTNHLAGALRKEAKTKGHNTTGYLSSEKGTRAIKIGKENYGINMPYYTKHLEDGTSAHQIPRSWKTELWAKKHGMSFASMRRRIAARGTKKHPFTARVIKLEVKKELVKTMNKEINDVLKTR